MAVALRSRVETPLLSASQDIAVCAAVPVVKDGRVISKGKVKSRLQLDIEGIKYPIAIVSSCCCFDWRARAFPSLSDPDKTISLNLRSLTKRLQLPQQVVEQAPLDVMVSLVRDRTLYQKGLDDDEKDNGALKGLPHVTRMVQVAAQEKRDLRLSRHIVGSSHSVHICQNGFVAGDDDVPLGQPKEIGVGTFARVKRSVELSSRQQVARRTKEVGKPEEVARMRKIAAALVGCRRVIPTLGICEYQNKYGQLKVASFHPLFDGNLGELLNQNKLPQDQGIRYSMVHQLLEGLAELKERRLTHRDFHLKNILHKQNPDDPTQWTVRIGDYFDFLTFEDTEVSQDWGFHQLQETAGFPRDVWDMANVVVYLVQEPEHPIKITLWHRNILEVVMTPRGYDMQVRRPPMKELISQKALDAFMQEIHTPEEIRPLLKGMFDLDSNTRWTAEDCLRYFETNVLKLGHHERSSDGTTGS
jgi:hypothetical protein